MQLHQLGAVNSLFVNVTQRVAANTGCIIPSPFPMLRRGCGLELYLDQNSARISYHRIHIRYLSGEEDTRKLINRKPQRSSTRGITQETLLVLQSNARDPSSRRAYSKRRVALKGSDQAYDDGAGHAESCATAPRRLVGFHCLGTPTQLE